MRRVLTAVIGSAAISIGLAQAPAFEVASIRPNVKGTVVLPDGRVATGTNITAYKGRLTAQNVGFRRLVYMAYGVQEFQVEGGPQWIVKERFDLDAKAADAVDEATLMVMLRPLLAERFGLVVRRETREMPAHVLVRVKKGSLLTPSPGGVKTLFRFTLLGINADKSQHMRLAGTGSLAELAATVASAMRMPIVDQTGMADVYDVSVEWNSESFGNGMKATERDILAGAPLTFPAVDPELNAAFQRELGLKFETRKAPVEMIVIQNAEHPSEN